MENRRGLGNPKIDGIECNYVFMMQWLLGGEKKKQEQLKNYLLNIEQLLCGEKKQKRSFIELHKTTGITEILMVAFTLLFRNWGDLSICVHIEEQT